MASVYGECVYVGYVYFGCTLHAEVILSKPPIIASQACVMSMHDFSLLNADRLRGRWC